VTDARECYGSDAAFQPAATQRQAWASGPSPFTECSGEERRLRERRTGQFRRSTTCTGKLNRTVQLPAPPPVQQVLNPPADFGDAAMHARGQDLCQRR